VRPVPVGFSLVPDRDTLARTARVAAHADYWEVAPETLWRPGDLAPNAFHHRLQALHALRGTPIVAHTVTMSVGSAITPPWLSRTLPALARDHRIFGFSWLTAHLGFAAAGRTRLQLPLALPDCAETVAAVQAGLAALGEIVPDPGIENSTFYALPGDPLSDARLMARSGAPLLVDLHNLYVATCNHGVDPERWLALLPLHRVIELHVSGGATAPSGWGLSRPMRLDSHDDTVPEPVWDLLEAVFPRCPSLRGVTLERLEGTVGGADVAPLEADFARLRQLAGHRSAA